MASSKGRYSKSQGGVEHEPGIILTGYVDSCKLDLYLNALGLLSPSLVEGFGIPFSMVPAMGCHRKRLRIPPRNPKLSRLRRTRVVP